MKLVIEHGRTKRQILGAFNVCGSRDDLESLARQILGTFAVDDLMHADGRGRASYLWIRVVARDEADTISNTVPSPWD